MSLRNGTRLRVVYFDQGEPLGHEDPLRHITPQVCENIFDSLKALNYEIPDDFDVGKIAEVVLCAFDEIL
jgi:YD repeat-containing protein